MKKYLFLLKNGPTSAYKVSKESGVNSAVVYREIERLKTKNLIYQLGSKKKRFEAISGEGLLKHLKKKNQEDEIILENSLNDLLENSSSLISMKLPEYSDLIDETLKDLKNAKKEILIRGWNEEIDQFYQILKEKEKDGLILHILSFTPQKRKIGNTYSYNIDAGTIRENWKRGLGVSIDKNITYKNYRTSYLHDDKNCIVELKTSINKNLDDLTRLFPFQKIRFSKYCFAVENLN